MLEWFNAQSKNVKATIILTAFLAVAALWIGAIALFGFPALAAPVGVVFLAALWFCARAIAEDL